MFLVFKVSVNIFKPWRLWEFSICSFNILSNIIYAIYSKDIFKNLKWNWDIFLVFVVWRKPKSTTGTSTRDILWMDLLRVHFIQARNTIIFKGIFRLVGRSRFFSFQAFVRHAFDLCPASWNWKSMARKSKDLIEVSWIWIPVFSKSAAETACINLGDKCGGFTLYQGQYYLKPGSIKFVASGPATCWTKEEKWANNYVPRAEWVSV